MSFESQVKNKSLNDFACITFEYVMGEPVKTLTKTVYNILDNCEPHGFGKSKQ